MKINYRDRLKHIFWVGVVASTGGALVCLTGTTLVLTSPIWIPLAALHHRTCHDTYENSLGNDYV